jgi:hypothetical protein
MRTAGPTKGWGRLRPEVTFVDRCAGDCFVRLALSPATAGAGAYAIVYSVLPLSKLVICRRPALEPPEHRPLGQSVPGPGPRVTVTRVTHGPVNRSREGKGGGLLGDVGSSV